MQNQAGSSTEEHPDYTGKVVGSIPAPPTNLLTVGDDPFEQANLAASEPKAGSVMAHLLDLQQQVSGPLESPREGDRHARAYAGRDLLSIDVEDYFQVEAFADRISRSEWPNFDLRVRRNTERILELLAEYRQSATFFVLGWVAEREPALVRRIADYGHELACHSHLHRRVFTLSPPEFRSDLQRAKKAIEDAGGQPVVGFRAPTFSIRKDSVWSLEILAEEGFLYDSSIFPIRHDLYGMPEAPRFAHSHDFASGKTMIEIPPSTVRILGTNLGVAGGGYLRHLPFAYTRWGMRRLHQERQPANVYFHPWEIDPEQPRIQAAWKSRLRHYRGLKKMEPRLTKLLAKRRFERIVDYVRRFVAQ